jgi:hypothetical protein
MHSSEIEADRANLVLDALDEAYDQIVVTASHARARALFKATEGRFDVGILLAAADTGQTRGGSVDSTFLGYEVADLEIIRVGAEAAALPQKPNPHSVAGLRRMVAKPARPDAHTQT